ncbi:MAG: citrate synthase, partial [Salinivirgaceae bacterium]|nr:citrate synthase [Salinivirgaceae bacterium]
MENFISDVSRLVGQSCQIDKDLFDKYNVKRGLRNADGSGVLVGLTSIGDVVGYRREGDTLIPTEGDLRYRGFPIRELVKGFQKENRHGFEETTFLLLTGKLPTSLQLAEMTTHLASKRDLDDSFVNMILTLRGRDLMNMLSRSVLILYTLDDTAEDYSLPSLVKQSLNLIAKLPIIVAYSYQGMRHSFYRKSLVIRHPQANLSAAENFLYLLKGNKYTPLEAEILDLMMILHAEHGGGNNSTFTMRLVSSAMTDTYSATAAAIGSLKGRLHGGA